MKKIFAIIIAGLMVLSLCACGSNGGNQASNKPDTVMNVEKLIDAIGVVTAKSGNAIETAEKEYSYLSDAEKEQVSNYSTLLRAKDAYSDEVMQYLLGSWTSTGSRAYSYEVLEANRFNYSDDIAGGRTLSGDWAYENGKITFTVDTWEGNAEKYVFSVDFENGTMKALDGEETLKKNDK